MPPTQTATAGRIFALTRRWRIPRAITGGGPSDQTDAMVCVMTVGTGRLWRVSQESGASAMLATDASNGVIRAFAQASTLPSVATSITELIGDCGLARAPRMALTQSGQPASTMAPLTSIVATGAEFMCANALLATPSGRLAPPAACVKRLHVAVCGNG